MRILTKIKKIPNLIVFLFVILISVLASRFLLFHSGYYIMHDDLQMMRQLEIEKCFQDFQIPCRWVPDMGYGYGFPLFNFYPPLPYLIGALFRIVNFSFITTVKLNFALSFLVSGIAMYLLAKEFFSKLGGLVASAFYIWAPYHAVDIYVRGAMNETWGMSVLPFIFLFSYKLIKKPKLKNIILLTVSYAALLLFHNLMVLIFTPFFVLWVFYWVWHENAWRVIPKLFLSGVWAFGLAAFLTLPALAENSLTWVASQIGGYYDYNAHFASVYQLLFSRLWGDGPSIFGDKDQLAFPVGHFQWLASLILLLLVIYRIVKQIKKGTSLKEILTDQFIFLSCFFVFIGWFSAFMSHAKSLYIWDHVNFLRYVQFPWRFLTTSAFGFSFAAGALFSGEGFLPTSKNKIKAIFVKIGLIPFAILLIIGLIVWNWNFFYPVRYGPVTDTQKFSGEAWRIQQVGGIYDYLPRSADTAPLDQRSVLAVFTKKEGIITEPEQGTYWAKFRVDTSQDDAEIRINIFDFPNWRITLDGQPIDHYVPYEEDWGRMYIKIPAGNHLVYAQLYNTPVRTVSNVISLFSFVILIVAVIKIKWSTS